jgi:hypothetical protein
VILFSVALAARQHCPCRIFLCATPREPRLHGVFELLVATFLLKACERGHFFEQKIQLAGNDQTDRCAEIARAPVACSIAHARRATFVRRYVELAGAMKKLARAKAGQSEQYSHAGKSYFPSLAI